MVDPGPLRSGTSHSPRSSPAGDPTLTDPGPLWTRIEAERRSSGAPASLFHHSAWASHDRKSRHRLLTVRDPAGLPLPGVAVQIDRSRVLPGHRLLRVHRFGHGLPTSTWEPLIAALSRIAREDKRVLRLSIGIFSREHRAEIGALLARHGFQPSTTPQSYRHTLTLDLRPTLDQILQGLHKTARKNLRAVEKSPFFLRVLTTRPYADRLAYLQAASLGRTGGDARLVDWTSILDLSRSHPDLSRVIGLFTSEADVSPDALVGFGWGCMHSDHGEYRSAGTLRQAGSNLPLSYPLLWNLIGWAREQGATWFDLGGITGVVDPSGPDPLAGISDFKRYFSRTIEEVGEEWTLEPHPARAHLAALLRRGLQRSARLLASLGASRTSPDAVTHSPTHTPPPGPEAEAAPSRPDLLPAASLPLRPEVIHDAPPHPPHQQDHPT